jgi:hypothetical protein
LVKKSDFSHNDVSSFFFNVGDFLIFVFWNNFYLGRSVFSSSNAPVCISKNKVPVSDARSAPVLVVVMLRKSEMLWVRPLTEVMLPFSSSVSAV